jgi:hypothetical protein
MPTPTRDKSHLYIGRRQDRVPLNIVLEREARDLLDRYAGGRAIGRFLTRLIYDHDTRVRERTRLKALIDAEVDDAETTAHATTR